MPRRRERHTSAERAMLQRHRAVRDRRGTAGRALREPCASPREQRGSNLGAPRQRPVRAARAHTTAAQRLDLRRQSIRRNTVRPGATAGARGRELDRSKRGSARELIVSCGQTARPDRGVAARPDPTDHAAHGRGTASCRGSPLRPIRRRRRSRARTRPEHQHRTAPLASAAATAAGAVRASSVGATAGVEVAAAGADASAALPQARRARGRAQPASRGP